MSNTRAQNRTAQQYSATNTKAVTFSSPCTPGSLLVVRVTSEESTTITVADSASQTWTKQIEVQSNGLRGKSAIFTCPNTSSSALTITASLSAGTDYGYVKIDEITGQHATPLDATGSAGDRFAGFSTALGALQANDSVFAATCNYSNTVGANVDTGFTSDLTPTNVNNLYHTFETKIDTGGAASLTLTYGGSADPGSDIAFTVLAIKTAAGAAGTTLPQLERAIRGLNRGITRGVT